MKAVQNGILLRKIDYSETSLILHFFTLEDGFQAYLFQGAKRKNKKGNSLQALSSVEISSYRRNDSNLGKITAISSNYVPVFLPFHPIKSGLAFFMAEVLIQVLRDTDADENMYHFIDREVKWLDHSEELTNYPIWFLLKLANQFGVGIHVENKKGHIFDMQEGIISNQTPSSHVYIRNEIVPLLIHLLQSDKKEVFATAIHKTKRREIVQILIDYFRLHINGFTTPKSLEVMQTIME